MEGVRAEIPDKSAHHKARFFHRAESDGAQWWVAWGYSLRGRLDSNARHVTLLSVLVVLQSTSHLRQMQSYLNLPPQQQD
jgi:hypothetical protein